MKITNSRKSSRAGSKTRVILGVTGGIAAYKSAALARLLAGRYTVRVVMTKAAQQFVAPLTFTALTGAPALTDMFSPHPDGGITHIEEARNASLIVVAPATADFISRASRGGAGDLLGAVVLASRCPVLIAPGMNTMMWENPLTQENMAKLAGLGRFHFVGPVVGELACGVTGMGRMAEPEDILRFACGMLAGGTSLEGRRIVVTAGPTVEAIDPVRFISNRSSGRMGRAIAGAARIRKATVTLITGPTDAAPLPGVNTIFVESTEQMRNATLSAARGCDVLFMAAAVADWKPAVARKDKIRKEGTGDTLTLNLKRTPDILASCVSARKGRLPLVFGFSLETSRAKMVRAAKAKLKSKGCDFVVANLAGESLGTDRTSVTVVGTKGQALRLSDMHKDDIAHALLDLAAEKL